MLKYRDFVMCCRKQKHLKIYGTQRSSGDRSHTNLYFFFSDNYLEAPSKAYQSLTFMRLNNSLYIAMSCLPYSLMAGIAKAQPHVTFLSVQTHAWFTFKLKEKRVGIDSSSFFYNLRSDICHQKELQFSSQLWTSYMGDFLLNCWVLLQIFHLPMKRKCLI